MLVADSVPVAVGDGVNVAVDVMDAVPVAVGVMDTEAEGVGVPVRVLRGKRSSIKGK